MPYKRAFSGGLLLLYCFVYAHGQETASQVQRDTSAIAVLRESVEAAGGLTALLDLRDYEISGETSTSGHSDEKLEAFVAKAVIDQSYRLERSGGEHAGIDLWSRGTAYRKRGSDRALRLASEQNSEMTLAFLPARYVAEALKDESVRVVDTGSQVHEGVAVHDIAIYSHQPHRGTRSDVPVVVSVNIATHMIVAARRTPKPEPSRSQEGAYAFTYSGQQLVNGISFPSKVVQSGNGQTRTEATIHQVKVNQGVAEVDLSRDVLSDARP